MTTHPGLVVVISLVALVIVLAFVRLVARQTPRPPMADVNARMAEIDRQLKAEAATAKRRGGLTGSRLVKGHVRTHDSGGL